jgi:hypothetical protein
VFGTGVMIGNSIREKILNEIKEPEWKALCGNFGLETTLGSILQLTLYTLQSTLLIQPSYRF